MRTFLDEINPLAVIAGLVGVTVFMFSTFSTIKYVDQRHQEALDHSDLNRERMMSLILEVRDSVKTIEARTWDMKAGQRKSHSF